MSTAATRGPEFPPPPEPGLLRSVSLAVAAHAMLVLALSWGITWKRDDDNAVVEAELWSARPVEAAPRPVDPPPPPPAPPPAPAVQPPGPPQRSDADIALERQREKEAQDKARREEAERQRKAELAKREEARKAELDKREQARKAAEEKKREDQARAAREKKQQEELAEKLRQENIKRSLGLAGATGSPSSTGTAQRSSGPSASYGGRLAALFRRNVVYPGGVETISGNPEADIRVTVSPTGEILSARLVRSSGNPSWDEAAVRAIERTQRIPPDENGRYVQDFPVGMRPKSQ